VLFISSYDVTVSFGNKKLVKIETSVKGYKEVVVLSGQALVL
jgi:hypothetical protein